MTTTIVLIASGILIGAGISVIWRDLQRSRRKAFVLQRDLPTYEDVGDSEVQITVAPRTADATASPSVHAGLSSLASLSGRSPLAELRRAAAAYQVPEPESEDMRLATVQRRWTGLQGTIAAGVAQVNSVLSPANLNLGAPGETAWSFKNKGFGNYRRLQLGEESLAWVRIELTQENMLEVAIKAHKPEWAALNGTGSLAAVDLSPAAVSDLLSGCLKPSAAHATELMHKPDPEPEQAPEEVPLTAGNGDWRDVDAIVSAALRATNGAFSQTGARLLPLAPAAWDAGMGRHRMTLTVEVDASDVARMQIERLPHEMEVAVGVKDVQMIDLGRRRRIPIEGMTTHALAELIASCAWPAIARFKEARRPA